MKRFAAFVDSETDENIWETVEDAYVYAFPLVLMDAIMFLLISCTGAIAGLGANTVEVALYPKIEQDADGNTLLNFL